MANNNFEKLESIRDEVALQAHLLKAELKDKFNELEQDWNKLSVKLKQTRATVDEASEDLETATDLLVETLRDGYQKIMATLRK